MQLKTFFDRSPKDETHHHSVAHRLYLVAALSSSIVFLLATSFLHFANSTRIGARDFRNVDLAEVVIASDAEVLLERHRRIIETAPIALDRNWIRREGATARGIIKFLKGRLSGASDTAVESLVAKIDNLDVLSLKVLDASAELAQDRSIIAARAYGEAAASLLIDVQSMRAHRLAKANEDVNMLASSSRDLVKWLFGTLGVLLILVTLSLGVVRNFVKRLHTLTDCVRKLSRNDTSVTIADTAALDEVGDIARAVEVFKSNAVALLDREKELERLNDWFEIALDNMARGLSMFDADRRLLVCNRRYREIYALPEDAAKPGTDFEDILRSRMKAGTGRAGDTEDTMLVGWPLLEPCGNAITLTHELTDGRVISIAYQALNGGGWVAVHEDITEKRKSDTRVATIARQDALTELSNRRHFREEIERALAEIATIGPFCVLWIDLDHFKEVNDTYGHPTGDAVLQKVADRLRATVRQNDFVARLGGDEFAIILYGAPSLRDSANLSARIIKSLSLSFDIGGQVINIGASIGVVRAPDHGIDADILLKHADIALYQAKSQGRGDCIIYQPEFENHMRQRRQIEADLRQAMANGELTLNYQPIVDLSEGRVLSCEALMRWKHPVRGFISPAQFIPIAEETGLITEFGAWVLMEACRAATQWPGHVRVSVNLSAAQVREGGIMEAVVRALDESGLDANRLELEVTETLLLQDDAKTLDTLHRLQAIGLTIALDDFGTGYASLSYLRNFPFDRVKIDQSFVRDLPLKPHCQAIVRAVVQLARMLGMRSVAEGVETEEHLAHVQAAGCTDVQGYLLARPVPEDLVVRTIAAAEDELAALRAREMSDNGRRRVEFVPLSRKS